MIDRVDVFVFLDDVQYVRREWKNRNRIRKTETGAETKWLTLPVRKQPQKTSMTETLISDDSDWRAAHLNSLREV